MIEFKNVYKAYKNKPVLSNISLTIQDDEFFVLIGSSGCGKTTLLKMINKLNSIDQGEVLIDGISVERIPEVDLPRRIGYVVQEGGLFPHMTLSLIHIFPGRPVPPGHRGGHRLLRPAPAGLFWPRPGG